PASLATVLAATLPVSYMPIGTGSNGVPPGCAGPGQGVELPSTSCSATDNSALPALLSSGVIRTPALGTPSAAAMWWLFFCTSSLVDEPSISISPATREGSISVGVNPAPFTPSESSRFLPWWLGVFCSLLVLLSGLRRAAAWAAASRMFHELTTKIPGSHSSCATGV